MGNDVHMLLEQEKMVGRWRIFRSTDIREMFDGERGRHQIRMVHSEEELLERAGKVKVKWIVGSERWPRLGWLSLGFGHDAHDCVSDIIKLVFFCEGECEVVRLDGYVGGVLKKTRGQVTGIFLKDSRAIHTSDRGREGALQTVAGSLAPA
jgi:hypothetical protein